MEQSRTLCSPSCARVKAEFWEQSRLSVSRRPDPLLSTLCPIAKCALVSFVLSLFLQPSCHSIFHLRHPASPHAPPARAVSLCHPRQKSCLHASTHELLADSARNCWQSLSRARAEPGQPFLTRTCVLAPCTAQGKPHSSPSHPRLAPRRRHPSRFIFPRGRSRAVLLSHLHHLLRVSPPVTLHPLRPPSLLLFFSVSCSSLQGPPQYSVREFVHSTNLQPRLSFPLRHSRT
jgi:hypothetical protein